MACLIITSLVSAMCFLKEMMDFLIGGAEQLLAQTPEANRSQKPTEAKKPTEARKPAKARKPTENRKSAKARKPTEARKT